MITHHPLTGTPVFICGYPKSGTTLLLALLDNHSELLVFPEETHFFNKISGYPDRQNVEYLLSHTSIKTLGLGKVQITSGFRDYSNFDFDHFKEVLAESWHNSQKDERSLLECIFYSYGVETDRLNTKYWVEKTPLNEKYIKKAVRWWPDLKAIYIIRDPRDNYCSYKKQTEKRFKSRQDRIVNNPHLPPKEKKREISILPLPLSLESFSANWLESINAWENYSRVFQNTMLIKYEELVNAPKVVMSRVCDFLEIDWDDTLLLPTRNGFPWAGNSMYETEFTGISASSIGRYEKNLSDYEKAFLHTWLRSVFKKYGWIMDGNKFASVELLRGFIFSTNIKPYLKFKMLFEQAKWFLSRVK